MASGTKSIVARSQDATAEVHDASLAGVVSRDRSPRRAIQAEVTLCCGSVKLVGTACDISEGGLKIICETSPPEGPVTIKLVGLPIHYGEIRWSRAEKIGIHLSRPLDSDVIADWARVHGGLA